MIITHKLQSMDLTHKQNTSRVDIVQDDKYSRDVEFTLTENGVAWRIPDGTTAIVRYKKPDGTGGNYDTLPDGSTAYQINGNVLTVALAPQVCTVQGYVQLSVGLIQGNAEINTFSVNIVVHPNPGAEYQSEDYIKLSGAVPNSGWTPNMYLGTDASGNVVAKEGTSGGGGTVSIDSTLTKPGQAADAAAVGNRLSALSEEIAAIPSGADGKSAYQYAVDGGYTGTETEFAAKLAQEKFANPNALTFTGAVSATYDGSAPVSVEIPSGGGGGSSGGSGKAKSQILIDQEITELTASLSVTLEHDFHNLIAIINCGSAGAALTAGSDGTAVVSKIGLIIDSTDFGWNSRKVAYVDTTSATWQTRMAGAEWSDDLSVFKRGFAAEIATGAPNKAYYFSFGGTSAMYGTLGTEDNAPRTGKTANIVVNGAYLNVGTRVILWGEYYE